jgi:hypothetical protein
MNAPEVQNFSTDLGADQAIAMQDVIAKALIGDGSVQQTAQAKLALGFSDLSKKLLTSEMGQVNKLVDDMHNQIKPAGDKDDKTRAKASAQMQEDQAKIQAIQTNASGTDATNKSFTDQANSTAQNLSSAASSYADVATKASTMLASLVTTFAPSI